MTRARQKTLPEGWERFYRAARRIPRGRVVTYGALAELAGALPTETMRALNREAEVEHHSPAEVARGFRARLAARP